MEREMENLGLICMRGCESFRDKIEFYLRRWHGDGNYSIKAECPRFSSGEGKGLILESIRGRDVFIITDPFNYSVTYKMYGMEVPMSPDDHYQDLNPRSRRKSQTHHGDYAHALRRAPA